MNSKLLIFLMLILSSCGVKAPPAKYPMQAVDSYMQEYTGKPNNLPSSEEVDKRANPTSSPLGI